VTALILSCIFIVYIVIPGILVRRIVSLFVPLRKPQWNRTEEITSAVVGTVVPFAIALFLVEFIHWFGQHPFKFDDSSALRWSDYKTVFSVSYSEKIYEHLLETANDSFWQTALRVMKRQSRLVVWFYAASALIAMISGYVTYKYGDWRHNKTYEFLARKFIIPNVSEWHLMLTPFVHKRAPKRKVSVEVLTPDHKLYRGFVGDYHIDRDNKLTGIVLEYASRYDLSRRKADKEKGQLGPSESYWRSIPGHALYLLADKIHNLNISYPTEAPIEVIAQDELKEMKIPAKVTTAEQANLLVTVTEPQIESTLRNFTTCAHCSLHGLPARVVRAGRDTPLISRSDGKTYHLFLFDGPRQLSDKTKNSLSNSVLVNFRYALDSLKISNRSVLAFLTGAPNQSRDETVKMIEAFADKLEATLKEGKPLASIYRE
jgi:Family of unknown function (DUF6338)